MCRGLNPDLGTWPEQLGPALGREVGLEERREGNPGNRFEPSLQSPHGLFCNQTAAEQALLAAASLFILLATFVCLSARPHADPGRACVRLGSFELSECSDDTEWGFLPMSHET